MAFTNHAEHFLTRIDRLNTHQAELALALYRDDELVRLVLELADLPERAARVAISLADGDKGPYVIVTREGRFVTCLGEGMHLQEGQVLISHHKLEHLSHQVERLRTMFAEARAGKRQRCDQLLKRLGTAGHNITQSEFDDMAALTPFIGPLYLKGLLRAQQSSEDIALELSRAKRFGKHLDPLLEAYWQDTWMMSHHMMLLGENPWTLRKLFEATDARGDDRNPRLLFTLSALLTGLTPWTLRGAWLAAQLPKAFLKPFKVGFCGSRRADYLLAHGFGLAAIGHRHQRYRAEVHKFFQSAEAQSKAGFSDVICQASGALRAPFEAQEDENRRQIEREFDVLADGAVKEFTASHTTRAGLKSLPHATKLTLLLNVPLRDSRDFARTDLAYKLLPSVAKLQARDFYLPEREFYRLMKPAYDYRTGLAHLAGRLNVTPPAPVRAVALPGRNDRCACGSGRKFKRCCDGLRAVA